MAVRPCLDCRQLSNVKPYYNGPSSSPSSGGTSTAQFAADEKIRLQGRINPPWDMSKFTTWAMVWRACRHNRFPSGCATWWTRTGAPISSGYANGATNTFLLAEIDDPYGRNTRLGYNRDGMLTNITGRCGADPIPSNTPPARWLQTGSHLMGPPYPFPCRLMEKSPLELPAAGLPKPLHTLWEHQYSRYYRSCRTPSVNRWLPAKGLFMSSEPEGATSALFLSAHQHVHGDLRKLHRRCLGQADFDDGTLYY